MLLQAKTWFPSNEMQESPNLTNEPLCFGMFLLTLHRKCSALSFAEHRPGYDLRKELSWSYGAILFYQKWVFATQKKIFLFFWQPKKEIFFFGSQKRKSSFLAAKKGNRLFWHPKKENLLFLVPKKGKMLWWCQQMEEILFFGHF